jgi:hypothetical protein
MPRIGRNVIITAVLACVTLAGSTAASAAVTAPQAHALLKVRDPGKVTGTIHGHCTYRDKRQLPDPRCTPGSIDPIVTQANIGSTICKKGWTATVRPPESQTEAFKYDVAYPAYGTPQSEKTELDHLVPLELGGSNDATNLWPEYPPTPNPKDKVENALNAAVCDGRVKLAAAQDAIAADWMTAEKKLGLNNSTTGGGSTTPAAWCTATASPANDGYSGDYDVNITSNQPDQDATATDANDTWSDDTSSTGSVTITLYYTSPGETITVTVGAAKCSTNA